MQASMLCGVGVVEKMSAPITAGAVLGRAVPVKWLMRLMLWGLWASWAILWA